MVNLNSRTDIEILSKVADSDIAAMEQLYDRYSSLLYSLIKKIVSDTETAEKILLEVIVIVWKRIDDFSFDKKNAFTWLVLLSRKKAFDFLRREQGKKSMPVYDEEYERSKILPKLSRELQPIELNDVLKVKNEMGKIISELTDAQRYVLSLFYFDGLNETEVAEKLKIPVSTVKSKLNIALDALVEKSRKLLPDNG